MKIVTILSIIIFCIIVWGVYMDLQSENSKATKNEDPYKAQRDTMVDSQIIARGVKDARVLQAVRKVPRHLFVPPADIDHAYMDSPLPIGESQTISQPYIVALMTELLQLKGNEKILEIGTGSGYQAAVLAEITKQVYSIEIVEKLGLRAKETLHNLGYKNIEIKIGDGYQGWKEKAPFDAIIVTAAPEITPPPLVEQLKEGGRLVIPLGEYFQELYVLTKTKGEIVKQSIIPVRFVPMTGQAQK